jgi:RNA polymerase sigma factor (sigma-70 family)
MQKAESDIFIWESFLAGNDLAYESIYKRYVQTLFKYGLTLTADECLIQDCIHDIFISLYENRNKTEQIRNLRFYLISALKNAILMSFRKQNTYEKYRKSFEEEKWIETETAIDAIIRTEEEAERKQFMKEILSILSPRQKKIVYFRYVTRLSLEEIAEMENIDYHSVANIIQRALKKIRKIYLRND